MADSYEVLIIGGGPAGLSAAMTLGRIQRSALVCDDDRPRNAASSHMNNFPSQDGVHPAEWRKQVKKDLEKYKTIHFFRGSVSAVEKDGKEFRATLSSGEVKSFKKVILAYGVLDRPPKIEHLQELWGRSVFHCPYCHGFEVRDTRLGLIANGKFAEHLLPMLRGLSDDVILFTNGSANLSEEFKVQVQKNKIPLIEDRVVVFQHEETRLKNIILENGSKYARDSAFVAPTLPFQCKSNIGESLGCEKDEMGFYRLGLMGKTTVEGVFAAGDIMTPSHSVLGAAAAGQMAGAGAVFELLHEAFQ